MSISCSSVIFYGYVDVYTDGEGSVDDVLERLGIDLGEYGCDLYYSGDLVQGFYNIHIGGYHYETDDPSDFVMVDLPTPSDEQIENLNRVLIEAGLKSDSMAGWYLCKSVS